MHDKGKRVQTVAEVLYFNKEAGYRPGDRLLWLRAWSARTSRNRVQRIGARPADGVDTPSPRLVGIIYVADPSKDAPSRRGFRMAGRHGKVALYVRDASAGDAPQAEGVPGP